MSDAVRIFLAVIYGLLGGAVVFAVLTEAGHETIWPQTVIVFCSLCILFMVGSSPERRR